MNEGSEDAAHYCEDLNDYTESLCHSSCPPWPAFICQSVTWFTSCYQSSACACWSTAQVHPSAACASMFESIHDTVKEPFWFDPLLPWQVWRNFWSNRLERVGPSDMVFMDDEEWGKGAKQFIDVQGNCVAMKCIICEVICIVDEDKFLSLF